MLRGICWALRTMPAIEGRTTPPAFIPPLVPPASTSGSQGPTHDSEGGRMATLAVPHAAIVEAERRVAAAHHILSAAAAGHWTIEEGTIAALERLCAKAMAGMRCQPEIDWETLASVSVDHEDPTLNAAAIHAGQKWAENDLVDHQVRA